LSTEAPEAAVPEHRWRRYLLAASGLVVVGLIVVFAALAITKTNGISSLPTGSNTAFISWNLGGGGLHPKPKAFSGTVAGLAVSGTAVAVDPSGTAASPLGADGKVTIPSTLVLAHWKGTLAGTPFALELFVPTGGSARYSPLHVVSVHISGMLGNQRVRLTSASAPSNLSVLTFSGTVGNLSVNGVVTEKADKGSNDGATATFSVTK
jgi:hypothetical protein